MSDTRSTLAPGLLILMLGVFVILRSVTKDDTGRTLIDRILGKPGMTPAAAAAAARSGRTGVAGPAGSSAPAGGLAHGGPGGQTVVGANPPIAIHDLPHGAVAVP